MYIYYIYIYKSIFSSVQFSHSVVSDSATPWTVAHQAPLSMEFSRQEFWSGLSCPPPGHLPDPGIKSASLMSSALADGLIGATWQASSLWYAAAAAAKSLQSCPTLCDPIDSSPLGSSVSGILQAKILEWVAIFFSIYLICLN